MKAKGYAHAWQNASEPPDWILSPWEAATASGWDGICSAHCLLCEATCLLVGDPNFLLLFCFKCLLISHHAATHRLVCLTPSRKQLLEPAAYPNKIWTIFFCSHPTDSVRLRFVSLLRWVWLSLLSIDNIRLRCSCEVKGHKTICWIKHHIFAVSEACLFHCRGVA